MAARSHSGANRRSPSPAPANQPYALGDPAGWEAVMGAELRIQPLRRSVQPCGGVAATRALAGQMSRPLRRTSASTSAFVRSLATTLQPAGIG